MRNTTAWIHLLNEPTADPTTARRARGSHCRTRAALLTEFATLLEFPDYFGHNWDAFNDCLRDAVADAPDGRRRPPLTILVDEAADLLADEPPNALATLLDILNDAADDGTSPRLRLLLDDTPDRLVHLAERMTTAGYPPQPQRDVR